MGHTIRRILFPAIAAFWVVMMFLLWRAEFGAHRTSGSPIPIHVVWEKILTAPDHSALQISYRGTNIGYCRWTASVGREASLALNLDEEELPDGLIEKPSKYTLDLEGNVVLDEFRNRLGFDLTLTMDQSQAWRDFQARIKFRPEVFEVNVSAPDKTFRVRSTGGGEKFNRSFTFSDLQNPQKLLREMGGPLLPGVLASLGVPLSTNALSRISLGLKWRAHQDWMHAGRTRMRIYRLDTKLLDRYPIRVCVSPVGEILRVELPGEVLLQHETLNNLPPAS